MTEMVDNILVKKLSFLNNEMGITGNLCPVVPLNCKAFRKKNSYEQCQCKMKFGDFCGRHKNTKKRYDIYYDLMKEPDKEKLIKTKYFPINCIDRDYIERSIKFYKIEKLIEEAIKFKRCRLSQKSLGNFIIKYLEWIEYFVAPYDNKKLKFFYRKKVINFQRFFKTWRQKRNRNFIKIQSICRMFLVKCRKLCLNESSLIGDSIFDIPPHYFIKLKEGTNTFGFDIRFLYKYLKSWRMGNYSKTEKNPYTNNQFDIDELKKKYKPRVMQLKKNKVTLKFEVSAGVEFNMDERINKLFMDIHHMNVLQPVKAKWFFDLSINDLKKLYRESQDWWHHRLQLTNDQKRKFINFDTVGDIFLTPHSHLYSWSKDLIQNKIISSYERLISEGETLDDCKIGAYNVISMLVTISIPARYGPDSAAGAHPHLIQDF